MVTLKVELKATELFELNVKILQLKNAGKCVQSNVHPQIWGFRPGDALHRRLKEKFLFCYFRLKIGKRRHCHLVRGKSHFTAVLFCFEVRCQDVITKTEKDASFLYKNDVSTVTKHWQSECLHHSCFEGLAHYILINVLIFFRWETKTSNKVDERMFMHI